MKIIEKDIDLTISDEVRQIGAVDSLLFFDIETTGFSGDYHQIYLIGAVYYRNHSWHLIQWFADTKESECDLLIAFFKFAKDFTCLVHFNGDQFDLPFVKKRSQFYHLSYPLEGLESYDIYQKIRPYKKLLGLSSMKQKSIEQFLGISRDDLYNGGELIAVYEDYLRMGRSSDYALLLLHNEDDLKGIPKLLPILSYTGLHDATYRYDGWKKESDSVLLYYQSDDITLPTPIHIEDPSGIKLYFTKDRLTLRISSYEGELKHFYPDYRNYYYLIYEDQAIHKSVGEYVDKDAKKKACASNCYVRAEGVFLPQPTELIKPTLKKDYKSKELYTIYKEELFLDVSLMTEYGKKVLETLSLFPPK